VRQALIRFQNPKPQGDPKNRESSWSIAALSRREVPSPCPLLASLTSAPRVFSCHSRCPASFFRLIVPDACRAKISIQYTQNGKSFSILEFHFGILFSLRVSKGNLYTLHYLNP
jgi:hypothetical protein